MVSEMLEARGRNGGVVDGGLTADAFPPARRRIVARQKLRPRQLDRMGWSVKGQLTLVILPHPTHSRISQ